MKKGLFIYGVTNKYSRLIPFLFPEARDLKTTPALFAAFHKGQAGCVFTGIALLASPLAIEDPAFEFSIHVLEPWRGKGIGSTLLEHIINEARCLHAPSIRNLQPASSFADHQMLKNHNFNLLRNTITHKFLLTHAFSFFENTFKHIKRNARIPEGVYTALYREDERNEISKLCMREFGALTHGHLKALGQIPAEGLDYSCSRSFWYQERLIGSWAVGIKDNLAIFDPLLIAQGQRNSWAFTLVIYSVLMELLNKGITNGLAQVHQDNKKIMAVMKRIDASTSDIEALYELNFDTENE